jgi:general secretion pathway protein D
VLAVTVVSVCCWFVSSCADYDPIPRAGTFEREANRISQNLNKPAPLAPLVKQELPPGVPGQAPRQPYVIGQGSSPELLQGLTDAPINVDLRFQDADIGPVVTTVLGDVLKRPYSLDSTLQGKVSLVVSSNTGQRALFELLRDAVVKAGGDIRRTGGNYEVVNVTTGRLDDQKIAQLRASNTSVSFVPLRNARASTVLTMLKAIYPEAQQITVDETYNMLIIQGPAPQRAQIQSTAELLDVGGASNKTVAVFPLNQGNATAIAEELRRIYGPAGPQGSQVEFMPIARNNSIMVIAQQQATLSRVNQLIRGLDVQQRASGRRMFVVPLQHARAPLLANVLRESLGLPPTTTIPATGLPMVTTPTGQPATMSVLPSAGAQPVSALTGAPLTGSMPPALTGATAAGPSGGPGPTDGAGPGPGAATGVQPGTGTAPWEMDNVPLRIVANSDTNSLLIFATSGEFTVIQDAIQRLDTTPLQVLIEATVMDVTLNDQLQFGVQAFFQQMTSAGNLAQIGITNSSFATQTPTSTGFNFVFTNPLGVQVAVNALRAITKLTVLSSPQVVTLDNQRARLEVGNQVPISTGTVTQTVTTNPAVINSISYVQTGVILLVTPRVNATGGVDLDIRQEVTDAPASNPNSPSLTPVLTRRVIETRVSVQSTQTVALGGLITEGLNDNRSRVPLLGDIPVVGWLFGQTSYARDRRELLVFLTPTVFRNPEEARNFSLELRRRLDTMWNVEGSDRRRP